MSGFNTKEKNNNGEYEITFYTNNYGEFKTVETLCQNIIGHEKPNSKGDLISRSEVEKLGATCLAKRNKKGQLEAIISLDNAPKVEPKTDILEQIIAEINTSNRGTCDYYIVDRIEEIINEYQKGGAE